jgi:hypothetical protein
MIQAGDYGYGDVRPVNEYESTYVHTHTLSLTPSLSRNVYKQCVVISQVMVVVQVAAVLCIAAHSNDSSTIHGM